MNVTAVAESEILAARKEGREPVGLTIAAKIEGIVSLADQKGYPVELQSDVPKDANLMLNAGSFAGVVRLQIGKPGDVVDNIVSAGQNRFTAPDKDEDPEMYTVPTMVVAGSDTIHLAVADEKTGEVLASEDIHLASDAQLELLDRSYSLQTNAIYLGERLFIRVTDPDSDTSDLRDVVSLEVTSKSNDKLSIELTETIPHSGVFTGSIKPVFVGEKKPGEVTAKPVNLKDRLLEVNFGDTVQLVYKDKSRLTTDGSEAVTANAKIHYGTDAKVSLFSKRFRDSEMAVRTRLLMAEALFEKAKQDRTMGKEKIAIEGIERARQTLSEAIRDCPNTSLAGQGQFLLANLAQEGGRYDEALGRYSQVISNWGESEYAPRCQLKKAICYEKMGNYDQACEEYVKLTYVYPDSPLVSKATIRLAQYYYRKERFDVASKIFHSFQQSNPTHDLAAKCLFLSAQCLIKQEMHLEAVKVLELLCEQYKEDKDLRAEAMYWQGESLFKAGTPSEDRKVGGDKNALVKSYQAFKRLTWDYPESKWAKFARGRLTNEVFVAVEESLEE